jgi:hypothetical protein
MNLPTEGYAMILDGVNWKNGLDTGRRSDKVDVTKEFIPSITKAGTATTAAK